VFLTLRGIQLQSADAQTTPAWLEIAPQLAEEPRQVDLRGPQPNVLVEHAMIPSGNYRALRLQFPSEPLAPKQSLPIENVCNSKGWNCVVSADGQVLPLRQADLVLNLNSSERVPFLFLPDASVDLQIDLGAVPSALYFSDSTGVRPQVVISGHVVMVPQAAATQQPFNSD
jgi:hypothetical protein